jgi:hypothetical protein
VARNIPDLREGTLSTGEYALQPCC